MIPASVANYETNWKLNHNNEWLSGPSLLLVFSFTPVRRCATTSNLRDEPSSIELRLYQGSAGCWSFENVRRPSLVRKAFDSDGKKSNVISCPFVRQ